MTKYKIVERFRSIQGEGHWAGTQMDFVRLSQCPVGGTKGICKLWDGKEFICDTGFLYTHRKALLGKGPEWHPYTEVNEILNVHQIWGGCETTHLCLTGGEPLIYDLSDIVAFAVEKTAEVGDRHMVHIETSGTVSEHLDPDWKDSTISLWITLSPKFGCLPEMIDLADELKLLVHRDTRSEKVEEWIERFDPKQKPFFLQPIEEGGAEVCRKNVERTLHLLELNDHLRLSVQIHKMIQVR